MFDYTIYYLKNGDKHVCLCTFISQYFLFQIQFAIMVAHTFQALLPSCEPARKPLAYIYMSQIAIMFYMFLDYYRKSYVRKKIE